MTREPTGSCRWTPTSRTTPPTCLAFSARRKCWRREALEALPLDRIRTRGYAFQIETTYRALRGGFEVVEIPIVFAERRAGGSKMTRGIVFEAIWKVPELRLRAALNRL